MPQLTRTALAVLQEQYDQQKHDDVKCYTAKVVQNEQIRQFYLQIGTQMGESTDLVIEQNKYRDTSVFQAIHDSRRSNTASYDSVAAEKQQKRPQKGGCALSQSLKLHMQHQPAHRLRHYHGPDRLISSPTPMERFLILDGYIDPLHVSKRTYQVTGCYADMESVDARQQAAHEMAEEVARVAGAQQQSDFSFGKFV